MRATLIRFLEALRTAFPDILPKEGYAEFDIASVGLNKTGDSLAKLLDPGILVDPENEKELFAPPHNFIDVTKDPKHPYPANAVRALWNIAARTKKILEEGKVKFAFNSLSHSGFLFCHFDYLSKVNYYSLKIVDNTTLKLAKLYLDLINSVLRNTASPDFFAEIPIPMGVNAAKEECRKICSNLSPLLSDLIKKYEARLQIRSTANNHSDILTMIDNAEVAIGYFEELNNNKVQPSADNSIPLKILLENLRNFDCQSIINLINELISSHKVQISSNGKPNIEYIYSPRQNGNHEPEMDYLTGQISGDILFIAVNSNEEALDRLNSYLDLARTLASKAVALQDWLLEFIDRQLTIILSQHGTTLEMAAALLNNIPRLGYTDEQYHKFFSRPSFSEDIESITLFLLEKEKSKDTLYVFLSKKLRDTLERINSTEMSQRIVSAVQTISEHVKTLITSEIEAFLNACDKELVQLPISTTTDEQINLLIKRLLTLKKIKDAALKHLTVLRSRYEVCPEEFLKPLHVYLLLKDKEINDGLILLVNKVTEQHAVLPLTIAKIESLEQKALVCSYIEALATANTKISQILRVVENEFSQHQEVITSVQRIIQSNLCNIEISTMMVNKFGDIESLLAQLFELTASKESTNKFIEQLHSELAINQQQKSEASNAAGILLDIHALKLQIAQLNKALNNRDISRPKIDEALQANINSQITALETTTTTPSNQSWMTNPIDLLRKKMTFLYSDPTVANKIYALREQLNNMLEPLQRFERETARMAQQKSQLEQRLGELQTQASNLPSEADSALKDYFEHVSTIEGLTQQLAKSRDHAAAVEGAILPIKTDLVAAVIKLATSLEEAAIDLIALNKQFAVPIITPDELCFIQVSFAKIISKINFKYLDIILEKMKANPLTQDHFSVLSAPYYERLNVQIKNYEACLKVTEQLAQLQQNVLDLHQQFFVNHNPYRVCMVQSTLGSNACEVTQKISHFFNYSQPLFGSRPSSPAITRENFFNKLDQLFRAYINRTATYSSLKTAITEGAKSFPFNGHYGSPAYEKSAQGFIASLFEKIAAIETQVHVLYSRIYERPELRDLFFLSEATMNLEHMDKLMRVIDQSSPLTPTSPSPSASPY